MSTLIIGTIVIGSMLYVLVKMIRRSKNHKGGCGCGCSGCPSAKSCHGINIKNR